MVKPVENSEKTRTIKPRVDRKTYLKRILEIKGDWFDEKEIKEVRREIEERLDRNEKSLA